MKKFFRTAAFLLAFGAMATTFTACDPEEDNGIITPATENLKLSDITATAYPDGNITISGTIEANTKIKTFELQDMNGKQIADLMNDQLKSKGEDGKTFTMELTSANVKVQEMYLVVKTRGDKEIKEKIGSTFKFDLGYGSKSAKGSYVSIVDEKSYTVNEVKDADVRKVVEFALSDGGLIVATACKAVNNGTYQASDFAQSAIYSGTIITSTGCIATYTLTPDAAEVDGTLEGIVINSKGSIKIKAAEGVELKSAIRTDAAAEPKAKK